MTWVVAQGQLMYDFVRGRIAQLVMLGVGVALVLHAVTAETRPDNFPTYELIVGSLLIAASALSPRLRKAKGAGFEVEFDAEGSGLGTALETAEEIRDTGRPRVDEDEVVEVARQAAGFHLVRGIVALGQRLIGDDVEFRLYTFDKDQDRLMPVVEPGESAHPSRGWRLGQGVTGEAFATGSFQLATALPTMGRTDSTPNSKTAIRIWWRWHQRRCSTRPGE